MSTNRDEQMWPIPESVEAVTEFGPLSWGDAELLAGLVVASGEVRKVVPSCVGMSLSVRSEGITLTLVATNQGAALLDGVQYISGGPCVAAQERSEVVLASDPHDIEQHWHLFARATAAHGIASTLSLPILRGTDVIGGFNLYAATSTAFDDHHERLAEILGAWAGGAIRNADLSFYSRDLARRAPAILREGGELAIASSLLAVARRISVEAAEERLCQASLRASLPVHVLARTLIGLLDSDND